MDEEFVFIKGYENLYKINRRGEIFSCWYRKTMKPQMTEDGYLWIKLKKEGKDHKAYIHRLLSLQYIENIENLPEVDHIDRDKLNNNLTNLRWVNKTTQNRNKGNYKDNLTPEQLQARQDKTRERARLWATKKRRSLGTPIRNLLNN